MSNRAEKKTEKVTQAMIAKECRVSQTLVSIVLSKGAEASRIAEATRNRIVETAERLGYKFRKGGGRPSTLAMILPVVRRDLAIDPKIYDGIDEFYARTQQYVIEAAYRRDYSVVVRPYEEGAQLTQWLSEWDFDGLLWHADDQQLHHWIVQRYPVAQLHFSARPNTDVATVDQEELATQGLNYLFERGHRRIVFYITGGARNGVNSKRSRAFLDHAAYLGLPEGEAGVSCLIKEGGDLPVEACMAMMKLPKGRRPTAFFSGDPFILELARALQEAGFRIPEDVSLLGIDNLPSSGYYNPQITSMDVCQREVGEAAVELLVNRIADPSRRYQRVYISPKIIERESVADLKRLSVARR